ncbi:probable metal-nicotianamine transporter YSL1 [Phragmites australis]|uniref:probable metal-nicotianamine transporter YSL1 n=1 Tax=Phragmites australis TaxID=29695 RepID=UPI002D79167C|nr:probable metal-nicotianamine transporter YSL1 [Phragmites australis]
MAGGDVAADHRNDDQEPSVEAPFAGQSPPPWWRQVTARSVAASVVLGTVFSFISMRIGLTTGLVPSLNMSASLLSFFVISSWTRLLGRCGVATQAFTRQENVVVQTCIISCATLSLYGGFTSYLPAMTETVAKSAGGTGTGKDVYTLHTGKVMAFLFLISFSSLFCTLPLRKIMILDYKLMYPSGSAIAGIVNSFHTPKGAATAKLQVRALVKSLVGSFTWAAFQWFYTGGDGCGFQAFPVFGLKAYRERFYFDFSPSLVGVGMICPYLVNFSLLFGAVVSSGIIWPVLQGKQGKWFTDPSPTSFRGINGYKVPMGISMVLGDSLFQLSAISIRAARHFHQKSQEQKGLKGVADDGGSDEQSSPSFDDRRRIQNFRNEDMPTHFALVGYLIFATISTIFVPRIFPQIRYYHVALCYAMAPLLAFCNSYASGLTDWSLGTVYGKLAIFIVGAWVGEASGGAIAGLAACGVVVVVIGNAAELMQDFKTAYLTLTSPLSMFASQVIGTTLGCLINPFVFLGFQKIVGKEHLGEAGSVYAAPMAVAYRGIAALSVEGIKTLPKHSIKLCIACFVLALCFDSLEAIARANNWRVKGCIPNIMAMAIPFFVGPTFTIDMFVGSLILIIWKRADRQAANMLGIVVASGLICGDGLWALPMAFLSIFKVEPPICMKFLSSYQNKEMQQHFVPDLATPR